MFHKKDHPNLHLLIFVELHDTIKMNGVNLVVV